MVRASWRRYFFSSHASHPDSRRLQRPRPQVAVDENGLKAKITPEDRHSEFPYIMEAFNRLRADSRSAATGSMTAAVCRFLTGNKIQNIPKWDIYEPLANKELAAEETMNLDGSQKGGIRQARSAPAGIVICHGGPGSGKTHFVVEAVMPFFLDTGKEHHVLLTAQGNRAADALALGVQARIQPLIESGQLPGDRYVLRLQSIKTEKSIFFRFAAKSRREKVLARAAEAQKSMTTIGIQHQGQTSSDSAVSHCRAFASSKYEFVDDKRVQHIELTLGQRMLQIAGLEPSIPKLPNMPDFSELSQLYQRFAEGKELSSEQMIRLEGEVEELMAFTIARATGVCATIAGAADSFFTRNYSKAELIVVDEASRVPEFHWWPLLAFYPKVVGKIMVGDVLPATTQSGRRSGDAEYMPSSAGDVPPGACSENGHTGGILQGPVSCNAGDRGSLQQGLLSVSSCQRPINTP